MSGEITILNVTDTNKLFDLISDNVDTLNCTIDESPATTRAEATNVQAIIAGVKEGLHSFVVAAARHGKKLDDGHELSLGEATTALRLSFSHYHWATPEWMDMANGLLAAAVVYEQSVLANNMAARVKDIAYLPVFLELQGML